MEHVSTGSSFAALAYLVAGVCFILALRGLSSPTSSQRGNRFGMIGMTIAVVTTLVTHEIASLPEILGAIAIGGGLNDQLADPGAIVVMRNVGGRRMAAVYDLRQVRRGTVENPELYGDDIIVVEQSGSKTAFRRLIESIPVLGVFSFL